MTMRRFFLLFSLLTLPLTALAQRQTVNFNRNWTYTPGWEVNPRAGQPVDLPHTWNQDALSGKPDYYRGLGNYIKTLEVPRSWNGKKVHIRFGGANSVCDLYVNGKHVGQHRGGYTAFGWDITSHLNIGGRNTIWVRVTNTLDVNVMPLVGDFNVYGGLYRDVELILTPEAHLSMEDFGSKGLYVTTTKVSAQKADVNTLAVIRGARGAMVETKFILRDGEGNTLDSLTRRIKLDDRGISEIGTSFSIDDPHLWNGTADPYLYSVEARVETPGGYDDLRQDFGIRTVRVDENNRFYLNDKPLRIQGVVRIEDWDGIGNASYRENHRQDIQWIKEMGANAVRLAYFPNDPYFLDLCDRAGILVWSEIPFVGPGSYRDTGYTDSDAFRANARQQLREMIHQQYNHPSVVWWGLFDQLTQRGDDPLALVKELNKIAKEDGGERLTVAASNQDGDLNFATDLIGFNQLMGWASGQPEDADGWTRDLRRGFPKLKSGVSAYGAGASIYQHTDSIGKPDVDGPWHPEQWQTYVHEKYWGTITSGDHFWGSFAWTMFDFGAAHRTDGYRPGINDCGLVTFDRRTAKDAFYFYKANWNKNDPFVYIAERRWDVRGNQKQNLKVFSNQPGVELFVNGVSLGTKTNDGMGRFTWDGTQLKPGENVIEALDQLSGKRDRITVTIRHEEKLSEPRLPGGGRTGTRRSL